MRQDHLRGWRRGRRGATYVITLWVLPALVGSVGLATDLGIVVIHKQRLQSVVDAAAMAGGQRFGKPALTVALGPAETAKGYARAHGYALDGEPGQVGVNASDSAGSLQLVCQGAPGRLDIEAQEKVPTYFLRMFGQDSILVKARASVKRTDPSDEGIVNRVAGTATALGATGRQPFGALAPLALNAALFESEATIYRFGPSFENMLPSPVINLTLDRSINSQPLFWLVDFDGSQSGLEEHVRHGYSGAVKIGDALTVEPGASDSDREIIRSRMVSVAAWLQDRIGTVGDPTTVSDSSWRVTSVDPGVLLVPVVKSTADPRRVEVDGFAAVQLSRIDGRSMQMKLVNVVVPQAEVDPGVKAELAGSGRGRHCGLYGFHIVNWKATK